MSDGEFHRKRPLRVMVGSWLYRVGEGGGMNWTSLRRRPNLEKGWHCEWIMWIILKSST